MDQPIQDRQSSVTGSSAYDDADDERQERVVADDRRVGLARDVGDGEQASGSREL